MSATHFPSHWTKSTLGQIVVDIEAGKSFRCIEKPPTDDWPGIVKVSAVSWGSFNEHESKTCPDEKLFDPRYRIRPGDLLMSRANTVELVGACVIVGSISKRLMLSDKILRIMLADDLKAWTLWYLRSKEGRAQIEARATGNQLSMRNIGQARILEIEIPLAPDRERLSIVEAIESYLTRLDDAMATLERVQRNLKRYRVSVLKAAVEGRLVPTEAELARAEGREYEPASVLLERILAERRRRWEEAELAKMKAKGKAPKNDKWKAKYVEPAEPEMSELPELPEGWCWVRTEQCIMTQVGHAFSSKEFIDEGVNLLRGDNIGHGTLRWGDNRRRCIQPEALKVHAHLELRPSDIVLAMDRPIISTGLKLAHVRPLDLPALLVQRVIRLRPSIHLGYFEANLQFQSFLNHLNAEARGGGVPHVSEDQIKNFTFPLPPLAEQARIAQEIERLISTYESSTQMVVICERRVSRLRQSILKWAFEGRLVDQDPNDEPAAVLLERIQAERAAGNGKKQSRTRRVNTRSATA